MPQLVLIEAEDTTGEYVIEDLRTVAAPELTVTGHGFVKADLTNKEPARVDGELAQAVNEYLRAGVEGGIPASDVADQVVAAIRDGRFWILTHEELRRSPVERMERAAAGTDPPPPALGAD